VEYVKYKNQERRKEGSAHDVRRGCRSRSGSGRGGCIRLGSFAKVRRELAFFPSPGPITVDDCVSGFVLRFAIGIGTTISSKSSQNRVRGTCAGRRLRGSSSKDHSVC
jgi:hypothetical protein